MRRGVALASIFLGAVLAAGCATSPPPGSLQIGQIVKSPVPVGQYKLPLPPGDWTVVAENERSSRDPEVSRDTHWRGYYLVQNNPANKQFIAAVYVRGLVTSTVSTGWDDSIPCNRKDVLYQDVLETKFRSPECLLINHNTSFMERKPQTSDVMNTAIWDWFQTTGMQVPHTVLNVQLRLYSGKHGFIFLNYFINPEISGLPPGLERTWQMSQWNKNWIWDHPARKAYFEGLRDWALKSVPLYRAALSGEAVPGQLPAFP